MEDYIYATAINFQEVLHLVVSTINYNSLNVFEVFLKRKREQNTIEPFLLFFYSSINV